MGLQPVSNRPQAIIMSGPTSWVLFLSCAVAVLSTSARAHRIVCSRPANVSQSFYDFKINDVYNKSVIDFDGFRNKTVLLVNVATYCGLTPQYHGFNQLMLDYAEGGNFVVIGLPCNQFKALEPGANGTEIMHGLQYVRPLLTPLFPLTEKIEVNGEHQHELYRFLKSYCLPVFETFSDSKHLLYEPKAVNDVYWNFEKFLVGRDGHVKFRFHPNAEPVTFRSDIEAVLDRLR